MALTAALLALAVASVANDIYAFIKPNGSVTLTVDTELTFTELGFLLEKQGVITNPHIFSLYARSKLGEEVPSYFLGSVKLDRAMSYREILLEFSKAK